MSILNLENLDSNLSLQNKTNNLEMQSSAISDLLKNVINWSIDAGIKYFLPDSIENEVIKVKNDLLNKNVQDKIKETIENLINTGKQKLNIGQNELNNVKQLENFLKSPETIKILSDTVEKILENKNLNIEKNKESLDKNYISKNIENNLDHELKKQIDSINKIEEYTKDWYKNYNNKDYESMNKVYKNIKKELKNIIPLENIIKETKKIENLNELIKNKGGDFNLTKEELDLANKLVY